MPRIPRKWLAFSALAALEFALIYALAALWLADGGDGIDLDEWVMILREPDAIPWLGGFALIIIGAQAALLVPMRKPRVATEGVSLLVSLASAAFFCALLLAGGVYLALELFGIWEPAMDRDTAAMLLFMLPLPAWVLMTPLLWIFCRRRANRESRIGRIAAALFLGSVVETLAAIPLDIMIRRRTDCYCGESTFFALTICGTVGLYAFGPAMLLPLIARRRKRWYAERCDVCGYHMAGSANADRCPECGASWRADTQPPE